MTNAEPKTARLVVQFRCLRTTALFLIDMAREQKSALLALARRLPAYRLSCLVCCQQSCGQRIMAQRAETLRCWAVVAGAIHCRRLPTAIDATADGEDDQTQA